MSDFKRTIVTAALPYANGPVHIGHLAGCYLPADVYVRYLRLMGEDVLFICGSDEHGVPITIKAKALGISPQEVVDKYHHIMKNSFAEFGISFDHYSRTSAKVHHETASEFFTTLYTKNKFTEQVTKQYYDEEQKQFLADRYIEGTCPKCGNEHAYGDQCERCGTSLSPMDLINPKSKLSGNKPVLKETKHWFLPLNEYAADLRKWILEEHANDWKSNVLGQCKSWIDSGDGLQPRAMTRDLDWGVPVPLPDSEGKVLYVWFDAPIGYISATKEYFAAKKGKEEEWKKYWQSKDSRLIHFIGKDNIVFHCIIFPAILKAHGDYILPDNVPANEFLNLEGDKLSTSRNWAVWLHEYLQEFPHKQDELRFVLTSIAPETKDSEFTWKDYQARVNNELVAIYANFVNRVLVLTQKYYNGIVPQYNDLHDIDKNLLEQIKEAKKSIKENIANYKLRDALSDLINLARNGNKYLADTEPWKLIKTDEQRVKTILYMGLEVTAFLAALSEPFLPHTSQKILEMLQLKKLNWSNDLEGQILAPGHQLGEAKLLFEKIEDAAVEAQIAKLHAPSGNTVVESAAGYAASISEVAAQKPETSFDDFLKMDIRVGTILQAERVPKTDKLLKLLIDTGIDQRTVVSGIAANFNPENIVGQKVSILVNLAPRKIKGIESKGMILMAENAAGELDFVAPFKENVNNGSMIK
ncbi:MAG: methionine--tRNA ligase [Bacteroidetes bacterium]|nr:methionine--tRNA ligase [Bacteroidota bacterium]